jgi:predicted nucleic acid-binding protein
MARILIDTSAVYALIDRDDENHGSAKARVRALRKGRHEPVLTNFLVAECHALLLARLGPPIARRWLFSNVWKVERVVEADEAAAREIIRRYDDKGFSYTDATSFAVMDRLGIERALSFDVHFRQYGVTLV